MASGQTLVTFTAQAYYPPPLAEVPAQPDVRNSIMVLDFDAVADERVYFVGILPRNYGGGGLTVDLHWMASTATSGNVRWLAGIERHLPGTDDTDAGSFASSVFQTAAAPGISGSEAVTSFAFTAGAAMDNLAAGERFRIQIYRVATDAADTMAGDAELVAVEIRET